MTDAPPASEPTPNVAPPAYAQPTYAQPSYSQPTYNPAAPGYAAPYGQAYATPAKTSTLAIVSLVLSLVGLGIGGIITGHIALHQLKTSGEAGRGLALAGTIIGYVAVVAGIIAIVAYAIFFAVLIGSAGLSSSTY